MTKTQALEKITASLSNRPQLFTPRGKTYDVHLEEVVQKLMSHLLTPVIANVTSTCVDGEDYEKYAGSKVWAIARIGGSWLLTLEEENEFALGFGDSAKEIKMHGFSSPDAIGEWCV